ncbi:MFS monocarboxylate transporter [Fonsecaea pedrosoi]|nr:MFS monocarboxylate transporter [Fonsecaea pedrosoi]
MAQDLKLSMASDSEKLEPRQPQNETREFNTRSVLTIVGAALSAFCTVGFLNAFGLFIDYYRNHQLADKSEFDISWIGSFSTFVFFLAAAPAGLLVDRMGPTILLIIGSTATLLAMFMISLCHEYYQFFLAQGLLLGIGQAFLVCPVFAMVSRHFNKNRGLATGFTIAGSSLGGVIWPIMVDQLLYKHDISFGWTIRIIAFTMLPLVAVTCITVRSPASEKTSSEENVPAAQEKQSKKTDLSILKSRVFLTFCLGIGIYYLGMFSPFFFVTTYAVSLGLSTSFAFYLVSILNAASFFGRISAGWAADKYGHFNMCSLAAMTSAVVAYCWTATQSSAGLVVWSLAYGFCSGSILSLQVSCGTKLAAPEAYGTAVGMIMGIVSLTIRQLTFPITSGLFGSPISGQLIKSGYLSLSMYAGSALVVGGIFICLARLQISRKLLAIV